MALSPRCYFGCLPTRIDDSTCGGAWPNDGTEAGLAPIPVLRFLQHRTDRADGRPSLRQVAGFSGARVTGPPRRLTCRPRNRGGEPAHARGPKQRDSVRRVAFLAAKNTGSAKSS